MSGGAVRVGSVFRADDAEAFAFGLGVVGREFELFGQGAVGGLGGFVEGVFFAGGLLGGSGFGLGVGAFAVQFGVAGADGRHLARRGPEFGAQLGDAGFEGVVPLDVTGFVFGEEVLLCHRGN